MKLTLVEQPEREIITLKEAKDFLRVEHRYDDDLIKMFIQSTREAMEAIIQKSVLWQTWEYVLERNIVPYYKREPKKYGIANVGFRIVTIPLPRPPVVEILEVKFGDEVIDSSKYQLDIVDNRYCLVINCKNFPDKDFRKPITIRYKAGMVEMAENIPHQLRLANLILTATAYNERYASSRNGLISQEVRQLLFPFLNLRLF